MFWNIMMWIVMALLLLSVFLIIIVQNSRKLSMKIIPWRDKANCSRCGVYMEAPKLIFKNDAFYRIRGMDWKFKVICDQCYHYYIKSTSEANAKAIIDFWKKERNG